MGAVRPRVRRRRNSDPGAGPIGSDVVGTGRHCVYILHTYKLRKRRNIPFPTRPSRCLPFALFDFALSTRQRSIPLASA